MTTPHLHGNTPPPKASYPARLALAGYLVAELTTVYLVGITLGGFNAVMLLLLLSILGAILLRVLGLKAVREYQEAKAKRVPPGPSVVSGVLAVSGAFLLFVPGFVSSLAGLLCVFPPTRFLFRSFVTRFLERRLDSPSMARMFGPRVVRPRHDHRAGGEDATAAEGDEVIEGEIVDDDPRPDDPRGT